MAQLKEQIMMRERILSVVLVLLLAGFGVFDFYMDLQHQAPFPHVLVEASLSLLGFGWSALVIVRLIRLKAQLEWTKAQLRAESRSAQHWKEESAKFVEGLHALILAQFETWKLTKAEQEIAMLLLKGFALKEISSLRQASESTVSQQSVSIYRKAGLQGRAELSAFFFEDLLSPNSLPSAR